MNDAQIEQARSELLRTYPGCPIKVAEDRRELVAEVSGVFAVAVIERSEPHFHAVTREVYRVIRGTLNVACGGEGHVLHEGESLAIEPGQIHHARGVGEPAWVEVKSNPPWTLEDMHVL